MYRKKPKSSGKCVSENLFVFNCQSLTESLQHKALPVERAVLRAYLKVIPRHLSQNAPMRVNMDVYMRRMGSETKVHSGEMTLEVDADSAGWIELNITKGVRTLWPFHANETHIEISVVFNSECVKKSPVIFEDPASISLSQARRRQRLSDLQPLFLVFLTDEMVKEIVANETASPTEAQPNYNDDVEGDGTEATEGRRRKRSDSDDQACQLEDFDVVFADLGLDYVKAPYSYNAKRCRGSCSHHTLSRDGDLGNNHAKLMASAVVVAEHRPEKFQVQPEPVCCIPTKYTSMTLITEALDGSIKYVVYSHMKVTECKCR